MSAAIDTATFEVHLPLPPAQTKGERERSAFLRLLPELLATHPGKFVAIHNEQVVDNDQNDIALVQRVHKRVGYVPIHVARVAGQPAVERISGPREIDHPRNYV
ncbi:MAG TPA: hypothetical protein VHR66_07815 [Gemmataceae bacterium]|jgi:hypothetical protein|nr:hypothetical protein [Gemmataceae bacterium]